MAAHRRRIYLLIHPEPFPSNDVWAMGESAGHADCDWAEEPDWILDHPVADDFDRRYGQTVATESARNDIRIALLDDLGHADWEDDPTSDLTVGVPARGRDVRFLDSPVPTDQLPDVLADVDPARDVVTVAGFARNDCVARVVDWLDRGGADVRIHQTGTLPLTPDAAATLADETRPRR